MDCQVAVAIVPKGGTLEDVRRRQATAQAPRSCLHEKIKDNKTPPRPERISSGARQQLVTKLLRGSRRRLWRWL